MVRCKHDFSKWFKVMPTLPKASRPNGELLKLIEVANAMDNDVEAFDGMKRILPSSFWQKSTTARAVEIDARKRRAAEFSDWKARAKDLPTVVRRYIGTATLETYESSISR